MTEDSTSPPDLSAISQRPSGPAAQDEAAPLPAIDVDVFCPACGYNLRGLTGNRCPECGGDIEAYRQRGSLLPWVYRDRIGRFRAFWKTVWQVTFDDRRIGLELGRPVDEAHARRFRGAVIAHAYLAVLVATLLAFAELVGVSGWPEKVEGYLFFGVVLSLIYAWVAVVAVLPYWCLRHRSLSPEMQQRAAVMTLYSCAPLAWLPVPIILFMLGIFCTVNALGDADYICHLAGGAMLLLLIVLMFSAIGRISHCVLGRTRAARWVVVKVVCGCLAAASVFFGVIPFILFVLALRSSMH